MPTPSPTAAAGRGKPAGGKPAGPVKFEKTMAKEDYLAAQSGSIPSHNVSQKLSTAPFDSKFNFLSFGICEKA